MVADYFLSQVNEKLDRIKVYELLMHHDLVEIEAGDTKNSPGIDMSGKKEKELIASKKLKHLLPTERGNKFISLFEEFEEQKTRESKFAKAVDHLDAGIHEIDYPKDWIGWTEEHLRKIDQKYFENFPELKSIFEKLVSYLKKESYFNQ